MSSRHFSRSIALQTLYEWDFYNNVVNKANIPNSEEISTDKYFQGLLARNIKEMAAGVKDTDFIEELANGARAKKSEIDKIIAVATPDWPINQITAVILQQ